MPVGLWHMALIPQRQSRLLKAGNTQKQRKIWNCESTSEVTVSANFTKNGFSSGFRTEGWVWAETSSLSLKEEVFLGLNFKAGDNGGSSDHCGWRIESLGFVLWMRISNKEQVPENFRWEHSFPAPDASFQEGGHQSVWYAWFLPAPSSSFLNVSGGKKAS